MLIPANRMESQLRSPSSPPSPPSPPSPQTAQASRIGLFASEFFGAVKLGCDTLKGWGTHSICLLTQGLKSWIPYLISDNKKEAYNIKMLNQLSGSIPNIEGTLGNEIKEFILRADIFNGFLKNLGVPEGANRDECKKVGLGVIIEVALSIAQKIKEKEQVVTEASIITEFLNLVKIEVGNNKTKFQQVFRSSMTEVDRNKELKTHQESLVKIIMDLAFPKGHKDLPLTSKIAFEEIQNKVFSYISDLISSFLVKHTDVLLLLTSTEKDKEKQAIAKLLRDDGHQNPQIVIDQLLDSTKMISQSLVDKLSSKIPLEDPLLKKILEDTLKDLTEPTLVDGKSVRHPSLVNNTLVDLIQPLLLQAVRHYMQHVKSLSNEPNQLTDLTKVFKNIMSPGLQSPEKTQLGNIAINSRLTKDEAKGEMTQIFKPIAKKLCDLLQVGNDKDNPNGLPVSSPLYDHLNADMKEIIQAEWNKVVNSTIPEILSDNYIALTEWTREGDDTRNKLKNSRNPKLSEMARVLAIFSYDIIEPMMDRKGLEKLVDDLPVEKIFENKEYVKAFKGEVTDFLETLFPKTGPSPIKRPSKIYIETAFLKLIDGFNNKITEFDEKKQLLVITGKLIDSTTEYFDVLNQTISQNHVKAYTNDLTEEFKSNLGENLHQAVLKKTYFDKTQLNSPDLKIKSSELKKKSKCLEQEIELLVDPAKIATKRKELENTKHDICFNADAQKVLLEKELKGLRAKSIPLRKEIEKLKGELVKKENSSSQKNSFEITQLKNKIAIKVEFLEGLDQKIQKAMTDRKEQKAILSEARMPYLREVSDKLLKICGIDGAKDLAVPEEFQEMGLKKIKEDVLPAVMDNIFQKVLDSKTINTMLLNGYQQLNIALENLQKSPSKDSTSLPKNDEFDEKCRKLLEVISATLGLRLRHLVELSNFQLGEIVRKSLEKETLTTLMDLGTKKGVENILKGEWQLDGTYQEAPAGVKVEKSLLQENLEEEKEIEEDIQKLKEISELRGKSRSLTLDSLFSQTFNLFKTKWDATVDAIFKSYAESVRKFFKDIGLKLFFEGLGKVLGMLIYAIKKLIFPAFHYFLETNIGNIITGAHLEIHEHLLYKWTDIILDSLNVEDIFEDALGPDTEPQLPNLE